MVTRCDGCGCGLKQPIATLVEQIPSADSDLAHACANALCLCMMTAPHHLHPRINALRLQGGLHAFSQ